MNTNIRQERRTHIHQGVESTFWYVIGDNIDEFKLEHGENLMLQRFQTKIEEKERHTRGEVGSKYT